MHPRTIAVGLFLAIFLGRMIWSFSRNSAGASSQIINNAQNGQQVAGGGADRSAVNQHGDKFDLELFLQTFQAANPTYQDYCVSVLRTTEKQSQLYQDMVLFYNFFWRLAVEGKKGFYVDSGANEWKHISNTFFYDVCLGWDGLCIEPDARYIPNLRQHRTCTTLNMCISAEKAKLHFSPGGANGKVADSGVEIECDSLQNLLAEQGRNSVDLWSLDVEGFEQTVLGTVDFKAVTVRVLLVEDMWSNLCSLDRLMLGGPSGLVKWLKMPFDSVYLHPSVPMPFERWLWPTYLADWTRNNAYREEVGVETCTL